MKYSLLLLTLFSVFAISSCSDEGEQRFPIEITIPNFTVDQFNGDQKWQVFTHQQINSEIESQLSDYGFSINHIKKIEPKSIKLRITTPGANFDNIQYVESFVDVDGGDSIKVAYHTEIPTGVSELDLNSQYSDIAPALKQASFTFYVRAFNTGPFGPVDGEVDLVVDVIAEK